MSKKERISFREGATLEIGKYYNVKCAIMQYGDEVRYIPIIGEPHKDAQFSAPYTHYHIDGRFALRREVDDHGRTNSPVWLEKHKIADNFKGISVRRLKCKRLTTGLRLFNPGNPYKDWYNSMIGKSCAGRRCPHLGAIMNEEGGRLVCPLHNLEGCSETEKIVPRTEKYDVYGRVIELPNVQECDATDL